MAEPTVRVEQADSIATLTLNRPEARNALDLAMREELEAALRALDADAGVRVVVVRGAGEHFCAGGDVKLMQARRMTAAEGEQRVESMNRAILALARFRTPTIAMVDGYAVGAGCNLALACDLIVASDRARFGEVFARLGLVPDGGGTWLLPRWVGLARAKELVFTAEPILAVEAERIGLVNRVVPAAELGVPHPRAGAAHRGRTAARAGDGEVAPDPRSRPGPGDEPAVGGAGPGADDRVRGPPRGAGGVLREAPAALRGPLSRGVSFVDSAGGG